jgi:hypothetical protein
LSRPTQSIPPGEGERRAQRGYVPQYESAAAAIYAALERDELKWVGLADRGAGAADDVVLGLDGHVIGHQFKTSRYPQPFRLEALLVGADGLMPRLAEAWTRLAASFPEDDIEIRLVTNDIPSTADSIVDGPDGHSAGFLREFQLHPARPLTEWRATKWRPFVEALSVSAQLPAEAFEKFLQGLRILSGSAADFSQTFRLPTQAKRLVREIANLLPRLVADPRDRDRWTRSELLDELGWRDTFALHRSHQFPVGTFVQRNPATETALRNAIKGASSGYVTLVGPPGSGKSTLLQLYLASEPGLLVARYLAFLPGEGQGVGRAEAQDFLDDINTQLKRSGLAGVRFRDVTLHEAREQFGALLEQAGRRYEQEAIRTLIIVDGLDHIPREERPERSLLAELPLPPALPGGVPGGVLIVLGTQRLDFADLKPAVQEQASNPFRRVAIAPLAPEAVYRMADAFRLDDRVSRERIYDICRGHPLVTRYLIEALRRADVARREALLAGEFSFEGDIEAVYLSAWREFEGDEEASDVLRFIAHAEGPIQPEDLAKATSSAAVERALKSTRHLLNISSEGWTVFHNSFRLFVLAKPRLRFGKPDPQYSENIYGTLAALARTADGTTPQRWLELRYLARAQRHSQVLNLAVPTRFRQQLADGRPAEEIQNDIKMGFTAAKADGNATDVFRLLLARDEIERRSIALGYSKGVLDAMLTIGDVDRAVTLAASSESGGFNVVNTLLRIGEIDKARELFDRIEPVGRLLSQSPNVIYQSQRAELSDWAEVVFHFRDASQIHDALARLSEHYANDRAGPVQDETFARDLRFAIARAAVQARPNSDSQRIAAELKVEPADLPYLFIVAAEMAHEEGDDVRTRALLEMATGHPDFAEIQMGWRRTVAFLLLDLGDTSAAKSMYSQVRTPSVAALDDSISEGAPEGIVRAVMAHSELATRLGEPIQKGSESKRALLQPLQHHASAIGQILGRVGGEGAFPAGEITRAARNFLAFLKQAKPSGPEDFYAVHQLFDGAHVLGRALIRAAASCSENEFGEAVAEFDRSWEADVEPSRHIALRREIATEIYRWDGNTEAASRRLEDLVVRLREDTPQAQMDELAALAKSFAQTGNEARGRELLRKLHEESLGNALAPKKDPQYAFWRDLLRLANRSDPQGAPIRVAMMMRQLSGMNDTEGRGSAYRIAASVLMEAATIGAASGFAAARAIADLGLLSWDGIVNAVLLGMVNRRGEIAGCAALTWCSLALPYYGEPHYREDELGEFISVAVAHVEASEVAALVGALRRAIEAESRAAARLTLLERLANAAELRGYRDGGLAAGLSRWRTEAPPSERTRSTPGRYDDLTSLEALDQRLQSEESNVEDVRLRFEDARAYSRLVGTTDIERAREIFERWPSIHQDSEARFALVDEAIGKEKTALARALIEAYAHGSDDRAAWSHWYGGGKLKYYRARLLVEGRAAYKDAYEDLAGELSKGRESASSVLLDFEEVFKTVAESPAWPAMWDCLAEQLATTREYALGKAFVVERSPATDDELIAELFAWALSLSLIELPRHVRVAALQLVEYEYGREVFAAIVRRLLAGSEDEPVEGVLLLMADPSDCCSGKLAEEVTKLIDHPDYAVAVAATKLLVRWNKQVSAAHVPLPSFYALDIGPEAKEFERPKLEDPESGAMLVEDPVGWTFAFRDVITALARKGVSIGHIRHRCAMLIDSWGGLPVFGKFASDAVKRRVGRLEMRLTYSKPHMVVAARSVRYVANDMRRAGLLGQRDEPFFLYMFVRLPILAPMGRPHFIRRPPVDPKKWLDEEKTWLPQVDDDVRPLVTEKDMVLAEVARFKRRSLRMLFSVERLRVPFLSIDFDDELLVWMQQLPRAAWMEQIVPRDDELAPTIIRSFKESYASSVPRDMLVICPNWLSHLSWRRHPKNWLLYLDAAGQVVANIVWWRDGGPVDVQEDVYWGEGVLVLLTPTGQAQLELALGRPLQLQTCARRTLTTEKGTDSKYARAVH